MWVLLLAAALAAASSAAPAVPDIMTNYYTKGVVLQRAQLNANLEAASRAAAALTAAMAASPRYKLPIVRAPTGQPKYLDPSRTGLRPQASTGGMNFIATGSYPRMPAPCLPPRPDPITDCPDPNSVVLFGARGNGIRNDADAILAANAAPQLSFIYFPPGTYRIARSITLTKPILAGAGATLRIAAGLTLTLTQRVYKYDVDGVLFTGPGAVRLVEDSDEVQPAWFKDVDLGETDDMALQKAVDSCSTACTMLLSAPAWLNQAVNLKPRVGVFSTAAAVMHGSMPGTLGEGFRLTPGLYVRPLLFSVLGGFGSFAVKIQGGVNGAEIQVHGFLDASEAIVFAPQEGSACSIHNVHVTHMTYSSSVQNTVVYKATTADNLISNCLVRGNFVQKSGFLDGAAPSAALAVSGDASPRLVQTSVEFQAIDAVQFDMLTDFSFVRNKVAAPVEDVVFRVAAWGGGLVTGAGKLIEGQFSNLKYLVRMSGGVPDAPFDANLTGPSNFVAPWEVAAADWELEMPSAPIKAAFNGGVSKAAQVHYLRVTISGSWEPGEARTFYFYNAYARSAGSRIQCLPFIAWNAGLVCSMIENQSASYEDQVAVTLTNTAGYALPAWQSCHRFGIQVGP